MYIYIYLTCSPTCPAQRHRKAFSSSIDGCVSHHRCWWNFGCRNLACLIQKIKALQSDGKTKALWLSESRPIFDPWVARGGATEFLRTNSRKWSEVNGASTFRTHETSFKKLYLTCSPTCPAQRHRKAFSSSIDGCVSHHRCWWNFGCRNLACLIQKIKALQSDGKTKALWLSESRPIFDPKAHSVEVFILMRNVVWSNPKHECEKNQLVSKSYREPVDAVKAFGQVSCTLIHLPK